MTRFLTLVAMLLYVSPLLAQEWNSSQQHNAILDEMAAQTGEFECNKNQCQHKILNEHAIQVDGKSLMIVTAYTTSPQNDCHACGVDLSIFVFARGDQNWRRQSTHLNYTSWGTWGAITKEDVYFKALSPDHFALFLEGGFTGQGYYGGVLELHLMRDGKFEKILTYCTAADNAGVVGEDSKDLEMWETKLSLVTKAENLSDLQVNIIDRDNSRNSSSLFTFDGKEYRSKSPDERLIWPCT